MGRVEQHRTTILLYISAPFLTTQTYPSSPLPCSPSPLPSPLCLSPRRAAADHQADATLRRPPYSADPNRPPPTHHLFLAATLCSVSSASPLFFRHTAPRFGHLHGAAPSLRSGTSQQASSLATGCDSSSHKVIKNSPLPCSVFLPLPSVALHRSPPPSADHQQPPNGDVDPTGSHSSSAQPPPLLTLIEYLGR